MKNSHADKKQMEKEAEHLSKMKGEEFGKAFDKLTKTMFIEGKTPQAALEINAEILENMYAQAYRLYNTGKYKEAIHLFRMLIMMNSMEPKYALGLAACFHMLKEFKDAVQTYMLCLILDPNNPIP
ncbi:MAG: tetratricopeptide repeat protein, partial [Parachlamydiaceae bacterium]|nr:tetratricopeptide repeat protein [Parachlamydiaceae bacterium]